MPQLPISCLQVQLHPAVVVFCTTHRDRLYINMDIQAVNVFQNMHGVVFGTALPTTALPLLEISKSGSDLHYRIPKRDPNETPCKRLPDSQSSSTRSARSLRDVVHTRVPSVVMNSFRSESIGAGKSRIFAAAVTKAMKFGLANSVIVFVICLSRSADDICYDCLIVQAEYAISRAMSTFWPNSLRGPSPNLSNTSRIPSSVSGPSSMPIGESTAVDRKEAAASWAIARAATVWPSRAWAAMLCSGFCVMCFGCVSLQAPSHTRPSNILNIDGDFFIEIGFHHMHSWGILQS